MKRFWVGFLAFFSLGIGFAEPKPLVALAPIPQVLARISHNGDVHHLTLPPSIVQSESVSLRGQQILGESLKNAINPFQVAPDYRFKPDLQPYSAGQIFTIPTPVKLASF